MSTHGDWDGWIKYFLNGVSVQAQEAADLADRLLALQERYREELQAAHVTTNVLALIDQLFINPLIITRSAQAVLGVSAPTARGAIKTLENHGVVREVSGRSWGEDLSGRRDLPLAARRFLIRDAGKGYASIE